MRHSNRGRRKSGKAFDDKTKYARMLAIPAAIVLVLLVVIVVMTENRPVIRRREAVHLQKSQMLLIFPLKMIQRPARMMDL